MDVPNRKHDVRPSILSIHPTMQCDYNCVGCYLKKDISRDSVEKHPDFFLDLIRVAKKVGMKEVAIPINYVRNKNVEVLENPLDKWSDIDKNYYYYVWIKKACKEVGLDFSITCNYDFFTNYNDIDLSDVKLASISMNDFVTSTKEKKQECLDVMKKLKTKIPKINCNILLSDHMIKLLNDNLVEEILSVSDSLYLLTSKPLRISLEKVGEWYSKLAEKFPVDSERVLIDTCVKYAFGLTNGICDKHKMIYINPYGEMKMCSFDSRNISVLKNAKDFESVYNKFFPEFYQNECSLMAM